MPGAETVFVDTNVLLYADDESTPQKQATAHEWLEVLWQRRMGRLSTQVLNEYYVNVTRKLKLPQGDARAKVRRYHLWQPWQIDQQTVETAWGIEARFGLSYWDALIMGAASHAGCRYVLSEDMSHEQFYGAVQVINPFIANISILDTP